MEEDEKIQEEFRRVINPKLEKKIEKEIKKVKKVAKKHVLPPGLIVGMSFSVHNTHYECIEVKEDGTPIIKIKE